MADGPDRPRRGAPRSEPPRSEGSIFAPVIFDDDGERGRPPRGVAPGEDSDAGLLRVLGLIVVLGIVIVALVLPGSPLSVLGGNNDGETPGGVTAKVRGELPAVPDGFTALSRIYDITADANRQGPWTLTVPLEQPLTDSRNIALYRYDGDRWSRITPVVIVEGGTAAQADVDALPPNIAVLQRTAVVVALALSVPAGSAPDPAAGPAQVIVVDGASVADAPTADGSTLVLDAAALTAATDAAGDGAVYLRVAAPAGAPAQAFDAILASPPAAQSHADEIVAAAIASGARGVQLDARAVDPNRRAAFTALAVALSERLEPKQLGLIVSVPALPTVTGGAYDWPALSRVARLWLYGPDDAAAFYDQVEPLLAAERDGGVDLSRVSLVVERASRERTRQDVRRLTQREALVAATVLRTQPATGIEPGADVTLSGVNLDRGAGNSGMVWDAAAQAVSFSYADRLGPHTVWIENEFSVAFRLDVVERHGLGGVAVAQAQQDDALPDVWAAVRAYVESGAYDLRRPYGPYLLPCWRASDGQIDGYESGCWAPTLAADGSATWHVPAGPGVYDVSLVVSDGTVFVGQQLAVRVAAPGESAAPAAETPLPTPAATDTPAATATTAPIEAAAPGPN